MKLSAEGARQRDINGAWCAFDSADRKAAWKAGKDADLAGCLTGVTIARSILVWAANSPRVDDSMNACERPALAGEKT